MSLSKHPRQRVRRDCTYIRTDMEAFDVVTRTTATLESIDEEQQLNEQQGLITDGIFTGSMGHIPRTQHKTRCSTYISGGG